VLPGAHLVASLLKLWLIGTLHFRVEEAHLPYYLDEYTFRFNRRNAKSRGLLFYRLLEQAVDTEPIRSRASSSQKSAYRTSPKQICRTHVRIDGYVEVDSHPRCALCRALPPSAAGLRAGRAPWRPY